MILCISSYLEFEILDFENGHSITKQLLGPGAMLPIRTGLYQDYAQQSDHLDTSYRIRNTKLPSEVLTIPKTTILSMMQTNPELQEYIFQHIGFGLQAVETRVAEQKIYTTQQRLIFLLEDLMGRFGQDFSGQYKIKLGLTQQDLSDLIGSSRQTMTSLMNMLKQHEILTYNRDRILIRKPELLENYK